VLPLPETRAGLEMVMNRLSILAAAVALMMGASWCRAQDTGVTGAPFPAAAVGSVDGPVAMPLQQLAPSAASTPALSPPVPQLEPCDPTPEDGCWFRPWGFVGLRMFPVGDRMAPNGVPYDPLGSFDLLLSLPLVPSRRVYVFGETRFWGQKAAPGVTNPSQGPLDFSKREFDLDLGAAWNYWDRFELRGFVYSMNNLNRGLNLVGPWGFKDGSGIENRYYFSNTNFDKGKYSFLSIGYYPSKSMVGGNGEDFKPGLFARASLIWDLVGDWCYLYGDGTLTCRDGVHAKLFYVDFGGAIRPFASCDFLEFRVGSEQMYDIEDHIDRGLLYGMARFVW
jgi:hypothetical protein